MTVSLTIVCAAVVVDNFANEREPHTSTNDEINEIALMIILAVSSRELIIREITIQEIAITRNTIHILKSV
ncbi:MAG: hypothetical protein Q8T08_06930 [Ignavibacteria bacterium]|nr:hypothetical protein [Ignavibacteria bacterium]